MELNESLGYKLYLIGTVLILFFAVVIPSELIIAAGPAGFLFAIGGMLASGKWPNSKPKDKRNKRLIKKLKRDQH